MHGDATPIRLTYPSVLRNQLRGKLARHGLKPCEAVPAHACTDSRRCVFASKNPEAISSHGAPVMSTLTTSSPHVAVNLPSLAMEPLYAMGASQTPWDSPRQTSSKPSSIVRQQPEPKGRRVKKPTSRASMACRDCRRRRVRVIVIPTLILPLRLLMLPSVKFPKARQNVWLASALATTASSTRWTSEQGDFDHPTLAAYCALIRLQTSIPGLRPPIDVSSHLATS
jgi:hypothetical protein